MSTVTDRNLLFGILALQMDFVSREQLMAAMNRWLQDKSQALGAVLEGSGVLSPQNRMLLEPLVDAHIRQHGGKPENSLAALSSIDSLREELAMLGDTDVDASVSRTSSAVPTDRADLFETKTWTVGKGTSRGERFRILRFHASGGLGRVSVAKDEELHRDVALKEIRPEYADDAERRARFTLEAEITGGLEHPSIVPVYGLGNYPDGRPFYAMRFIKGDSLKEAIELFHEADKGPHRIPRERSVELRKLLGRFIDVCHAIEYAHSRGVLHRDLKPGNIMLGKYGETLVVDWGLAKAEGRDDQVPHLASEAALMPVSDSEIEPTQMGAMVGTLQYMSPEQAVGRLDLLGPTTDVYSLGATLYHILTGQPPITGQDRDELVRNAQTGNFRPPRELKGNIPPALEAVCLRAMAKEPKDRYSRPLELVDDLEHWLADEPVSARRDTLLDRVTRFGRRHRSWVIAGGIALMAVTIVSLISGFVVDRQRREANASELVAKRQEQVAKTQEQAARTQEQLARKQEAIAKANLHKAIQAVDQMLTRVADERLAHVPQMELVRKSLLEDAQKVYQDLLKEQAHDLELRLQVAISYGRMGDIQQTLNQVEASAKSTKQSVALLEQLVSEFPDNSACAFELGKGYSRLGFIHAYLGYGKPQEGIAAYEKVRLLYERLNAQQPSAEYRLAIAGIYEGLAAAKSGEGSHAEAIDLCHKGLEIVERELSDNPKEPAVLFKLAELLYLKGVVLERVGKFPEAETSFRRTVELREVQSAGSPSNTVLRHTLAMTYVELAFVLNAQGQKKAGSEAAAKGLAIWGRLVAEFPVTFGQMNGFFLDRAHFVIMDYFDSLDPPSKTEDQLRSAVFVWEQYTSDFSKVNVFRDEAVARNLQLANWLTLAGRHKEATASFLRAIELKPMDAKPWFHKSLASLAQSDEKGAIEGFSKVLELDASYAAAHNHLAWLLVTCSETKYRDPPRAVALASKATEIAPEQADYWTTLGATQFRAGRPLASVESLSKAIQIRKQGTGREFLFLAMAHQQLNEFELATTYYNQGKTWLENTKPPDQSLELLRTEAKELLKAKE